MQVTKGTWRMREQCVPGSLSSSPAQEPGNEAIVTAATAGQSFDRCHVKIGPPHFGAPRAPNF